MIEHITPAVGQIWADNDKRAIGRKIRIDKIEGGTAHCTVVSDRDIPEAERERYRHDRPEGWTSVGRSTRISLKRLRPIATGYRLTTESAQA